MTKSGISKELQEELNKRDPREKEFHRLNSLWEFAKNPEDEKIAEEKLAKFKRENPDLMDELHTRRWTSPY
jgi:hypothetical protein